MKKDIINPHDKFFRAAMEDTRVAKEFLTAHLPNELREQIDLNFIEICPETFVDDELKLSQSDVIIKTKVNEQAGFIYILVEHQSTVDANMPLRLFKYMVKIWEQFQHQHAPKKKLIFPVIIPMVFYTGKKVYSGKRAMWALCGENERLMHHLLSNPFCLIDVNTIPDEELRQRLFSGTMEFVMRQQFRQHFEEQLLKIIGNLARLTIDPNDNFLLKLLRYILIIDETHDSIQSLIMTIHDHAPPSIRGNVMGLAEKIYHEGEVKGLEEGIEKGLEEGLVKGLEKGLEEGKRLVAQNMLTEGIEPLFVAKVTGLPLDMIKKLQFKLK